MNREIYQIHEVVEVLIKHLPVLLKQHQILKNKANRTSKEEMLLKTVELRLSKYLPYIRYYKNFFRTRGHKGAIAFYYCLKEHADAGDKEARRILIELKPHFRKALVQQMNFN
jgi:hypothetical protein